MDYALYLLQIAAIQGAGSSIGWSLSNEAKLLHCSTAAYFAIGAYAAAVSLSRGVADALLVIAVASCAAALCGYILESVLSRLPRNSFILLTFVFQLLASAVFSNWYTPLQRIGSWGNLTNGPFGISIDSPFTIGGFVASAPLKTMLVLLSTTLMVWATHRLSKGGAAVLAKAIGDDESLLWLSGVRTLDFKRSLGTTMACCYGILGALYFFSVGHINPDSVTLGTSLFWASTALIAASPIRAALWGALLIAVFPEVLRHVNMPFGGAFAIRNFLLAALLLYIAVDRSEEEST